MTDVFGVDIPFAEHCGIIPLEGSAEKTRLTLTLDGRHQNHFGLAHGGVILTLLDIATGSVARLASGHSVVTISLQSAFLAPGRGALFAEGRVVKLGRSMIFCEGEVRDAQGELVAKASSVFKTVRKSAADPGTSSA